jgi:integrase
LLAGYAYYLVNEYKSPDGFKLGNITIKNGINVVKNFLEYHDIEIIPRKYKLKVKYPRVVRQDKEALTKEDVAKIIQSCTSYKLKIFIHFLAVSGCRASEACSIRLEDINFNDSKVKIRGEHTKTKEDRYVFITEEFKMQLKEYLRHKYRRRVKYYKSGKPPITITPKPKGTDLIFGSYLFNDKEQGISFIYNNLLIHFERTLKLLKISYENITKRRHAITFHSFRRFVKSTISDLGYSDYSEWYIGHSGSTYYRSSESEKIRIFKKIEGYLTFLDVTTLERKGADMQTRLDVLEHENISLRSQVNKYDGLLERIAQLEKKYNVS